MLVTAVSAKTNDGGFIAIAVSKLGGARVPACVIEGGATPGGALVTAVVEVFPIVTAIDEDSRYWPATAPTTEGDKGSCGVDSTPGKARVEGVGVVGEVIIALTKHIVNLSDGGRHTQGGTGAGRKRTPVLAVNWSFDTRVEVGGTKGV